MDQLNPTSGFILLMGGLVGFAALLQSMQKRAHSRLLKDLPTSKAQGVFIGLVELKGRAESASARPSPLAGVPCVWFSWTVEEKCTHETTESYQASDGTTKTRRVSETEWREVAQGNHSPTFLLRDETGTIQVLPYGATIEAKRVFDQTCGRDSPLYFGKGPSGELDGSRGKRRFREEAIPVGAELYVVGQARERGDAVAPEIAAATDAPEFIISVRGEAKVRRTLLLDALIWPGIGLLVLGGTVALAVALSDPPHPDLVRALWWTAGVYALAWTLGWLWTVYNSLVGLRQRVRQAVSLVEVQLERRNSLLPNLVSAVAALGSHERPLQNELALLRTQAASTAPGQQGPDAAACARVVAGIVERHPALKAQDAFLRLQRELSDTEQRIALARGYANDIATYYNTRLRVVPDRLLAALARLQAQPLWTGFDSPRAAEQGNRPPAVG